MNMRIFLICCLLFSAIYTSWAQPGWTFHKNADIPVTGISFCIELDYSSGDIYLGLTGGLTKFDGSKWTAVYYNESNPSGHYNEYNIRMVKHFQGAVWASTNEGFFRFVGSEKKRFYSGNTRNFSDDWIRGITPDKDGNIWFLSRALAISKLDVAADTVINYIVPHSTPLPFINDAHIFSDSYGGVWYTVDGGFAHFKDGELKVLDSTDIPTFKEDELRSIHIQFDSSILTLFKRRVGIYKNVAGIKEYKEISVPDTILDSDENFSLVEVDNNKNIWILSRKEIGQGIKSQHFYRLTPDGEWTKYEFPYIEGTISQSYSFTGLTVDKSGKVWFTEPYYGVFVFDPKHTSTIEAASDKLEILPNPAHDYLNVSNFNYPEKRYTILDILGREVSCGELSDGRIQVSGLNSGVFFIRFGNEIKSFVKN